MQFDLVKQALIRAAEAVGLCEYEIFFSESSNVSAETLKDEISSFSSSVSGGIGFRCVVDGHLGCASTALLTEEEMVALVARATENAKNIESEDKAIIFEGSEHYESCTPPQSELMSAAQVKDLALRLQREAYSGSEWIVDGTQSGVVSEKLHYELINSKGLSLSNNVCVSAAYLQAVIQKDGESQDGFSSTADMSEEKLSSLSKEAINHAETKIGATSIASGKYDVIFSAKQMRALLSTFDSVFSGRQAMLGLSLLKGKEGEQIASTCVTLVDDPRREGCTMQTSFDGEGVATYRKNVIENGVLRTLLYDLATADRMGVTSTGNGQRSSYTDSVSIAPYSFYMVGGLMNHDALFAQVSDGIYITDLKGLHAGANAVTGDFSLESAGFRIREGKKCEAVRSFTVAGNFFELLRNIEALSDEVSFGLPSGLTSYGAPDALIRKMSVAGT